METIELISDGWVSGPVLVPRTFRERWRGLRGDAGDRAMLTPGGSVHGVGMSHPLHAVGLDRRCQVVGVRRLDPGRVVWIRRATSILELPTERTTPSLGAQLVRAEPDECRAS